MIPKLNLYTGLAMWVSVLVYMLTQADVLRWLAVVFILAVFLLVISAYLYKAISCATDREEARIRARITARQP